jgi:hypothetical protein
MGARVLINETWYKPLFATHYFTYAAWRAEQRDEVSSRQAVLIHKVADQIGELGGRRGISFPRTRQPGGLAPPDPSGLAQPAKL